MAYQHTIRTKKGTETVALTPMRAIRRKCLDCSCWNNKVVRDCPIETCPLHPYRLGKKPTGGAVDE
jgi:hypothetical protein